jgi:hypothetical protein
MPHEVWRDRLEQLFAREPIKLLAPGAKNLRFFISIPISDPHGDGCRHDAAYAPQNKIHYQPGRNCSLIMTWPLSIPPLKLVVKPLRDGPVSKASQRPFVMPRVWAASSVKFIAYGWVGC